MQKLNKLIKILCTFLLCIVIIKAQAQTGLNFQGVARTTNNIIVASQPISLRLSILQGSATGIAEYVETRRVTTNAQGLFTAVIGDTGSISTLGNFSTINWKNTPKFLKIEMDPAAGNNFITMGTTEFQYVAYAQFAKSVDAENISGVVPVARGGTGANSLSAFKTAMALDKVNNTADTEKPISAKTQTALDLKLNADDTSKYTKQIWTDSALLSKINNTDTIKYVKKTYADSSLLTKLKITDTAAMLSNRIGKDTINLSARINEKANNSDVTTSLALKENASNKSSATDLGGTSPSDLLYPTQKAVKAYVTANASSGGVADGGITTIKLADAAVTDAKLGTGISKSKVGLSNVENISISSWTGTSSLTTVGTITSGIWSGTAISLNNGGTGATNAAQARSNLGLVIGTNVQAPLTAGTDYLTPTGNAATATTAGNITATSNSTLTSLPNLTSVGTITSGTWSGTMIAISNGGTGTRTTTANSIFAGPNGIPGAPSFRTLNINDIPDLSSRYFLNNGSDITVSGQRIGIGDDPNQGHLNLVFGKQALSILGVSVGSGSYDVTMNTAIGPYSQSISEGNKNTSLGTFSLSGLGEGDNNTAIGAYAFTENNVDENLASNIRSINANNNTSIGAFALSYPSTYNSVYSPFNYNTAIGAYALSGLTINNISDTSNRNTVIGYKAGSNLLTGSNNIFIGNNAQPTSTTVSNQIVVGNASNTSSYIYGALTTTGRISKMVTVASNYTILPSDEIIIANSSSPINIELPSAIGISGRTYTIKNINSGAVSVKTILLQNIDASNTYQLTNQYSFIRVISNGSKWLVAGLDNVSYSVSGGLTLTDVQTGVLSNTSGINTGDETSSTIKTKLGITDPAISGNNNDATQILTGTVGSGELLFKDLYDINASLFDDKASLSASQNNFTGDLKAKTYILTNPTTTTASSATTTINLATGNVLEVLLTANTTLSFTNPRIGTYIIKIKQDGTGGRVVTFPSIKWADDAVPTITATANRTDLITLIYDGTNYYATCLQNF